MKNVCQGFIFCCLYPVVQDHSAQVSPVFLMFGAQCELAVDAVHRRSEEEGSTSLPPRREEITDTMIFTPSDLVTMICKDVDLNYATRGTATHAHTMYSIGCSKK